MNATLAAVGIIIIAAVIIYFRTGTSKDLGVKTVNPAFGEYVSSYTAGVVSSASAIRIALSRDVVEAEALGETPVKLFDFSPSMKGTTIWIDRHTVEFRPAGRWSSGQVYTAEFNLGRIMEVGKDLATFEYSFQIIPQNFELSIDNVSSYSATELNRQKVDGVILTADFAEGAAVEKMLSASQEDQR